MDKAHALVVRIAMQMERVRGARTLADAASEADKLERLVTQAELLIAEHGQQQP